ncbi:EVE domain-containing protein [Herbaspirillum sp. alder98]|uniref:EVE domain-containing protein n=1 Tax=Herbaspirillum sp. alder98 TaxID=2913096 RepID=UPI001CD8C3F9|nr:EVE domain-containing protein [Herbaspirillum sp. alder98]MCA1324207.1 EVE domain-containing protein [Herbaspirillum sp. alder98]
MSRAWLGVVSRSHVIRGVAGGFAQVCHGKAGPLRQIRKNDIFIYYSPTVEMNGPSLRAFTAIGTVQDEDIFEYDMGNGFVPFRRRVRYAAANEVPLEALRHHLDLCAAPNWGMALRRGLIPLTTNDMHRIAQEMQADMSEMRNEW